MATVLATGVGAVPVAALGPDRVAAWRPGLSGLAAGAMAIAAIVGLLVPALDGGDVSPVAVGTAIGAAGLVLLRRGLTSGHEDRGWVVTAVVLFAHSLPEGFAIGTAVGSGEAGLGVFVVAAIALQNVPEGTATALPMQAAGHGSAAQVTAAIATSLPQVPGALVAYALVDGIRPLLPVSFGFAAGAMLALVAVDLLPQAARRRQWRQGVTGIAIGAAAMAVLAAAAGV